MQVIQNNGTVITEFIPHDTTNTVRSLQGKANQCDVWLRVEAVDPQITQVTVEAHTKWGGSNIDLAHEWKRKSRCNWRGDRYFKPMFCPSTPRLTLV